MDAVQSTENTAPFYGVYAHISQDITIHIQLRNGITGKGAYLSPSMANFSPCLWKIITIFIEISKSIPR